MTAPTIDILYGDAWELALTLEPDSIDCIVTSPPYWALRDYGHPGQFGLEKTPEEYVSNLVRLFDRLRPALKDAGTVWLNLGDCYATGAGKVGECPGGGDQGERWKGNHAKGRGTPKRADGTGARSYVGPMIQPNRMPLPGLKPKDLVGIPWRTAFALQADGWYLRSDIVWAKPNPMPESVRDRPTKAHEYIFLLANSERYYFDAEAVQEGILTNRTPSRKAKKTGAGRRGLRTAGKEYSGTEASRHIRSVWTVNGADDVRVFIERNLPDDRATQEYLEQLRYDYDRGVLRTIWTIPTQPYTGAHFAVFPPKLIEPCIKAGTSERGVCPECGKPWTRIVQRHRTFDGQPGVTGTFARRAHVPEQRGPGPEGVGHWRYGSISETRGWRPSCDCGRGFIPATVLDPFLGSGTTAQVARSLGRNCIGFELNKDYRTLIEERLAQGVLL